MLLGTGGVSIWALQLAKAAGARVIITSSSDEKLERAKELGAWQVINYRTQPAWDEAARGLTSGMGVNHVLEMVGGDNARRSLNALAADGRLVDYQPYWAARAALLARTHACGDARHAFDVAIGLTGDPAVRRFLQDRQAALPR